MDKSYVNSSIAIIFIAMVFSMLIAWSQVYSVVKTPDIATCWSAYGTIIQALCGAFQAIFAGILIVITKALAQRQADISQYQNNLAEQQNKLAEEQKEMTRRQINIDLFDKRYIVYGKIIKLATKCIADEPVYDLENLKENCEEAVAYSWKARSVWYEIKDNKIEITFLFNKRFADEVMGLIDEILELDDILIKKHMEHMDGIYRNGKNDIRLLKDIDNIRNDIRKLKNEVDVLFSEYLNFENHNVI